MSRALATAEPDRRNVSLDILKLVMALMVVGLHGNFLREYSEPLWWYCDRGLFRMAVPVFLTLNGYFFALNAGSRQRQWLARILALYAIWMAIYAPLWLPETDSAAQFAVFIVFGWFHLWYLAGIIGAAGCLIALQRLGAGAIAIIAAICFLAGVAFQYAAFQVTDTSLIARVLLWNPSHRNFLLFSFPFFAVGYLIQKLEIGRSLSTRAIVMSFLTGAALLFLEVTAVRGFHDRRGDVDNLLSLGIFAPAAFLLALRFPVERGWGKQASLLANGIYFTHPLFLMGLGLATWLRPTLATMATAVASAALTVAIMAIPKLSRRLL